MRPPSVALFILVSAASSKLVASRPDTQPDAAHQSSDECLRTNAVIAGSILVAISLLAALTIVAILFRQKMRLEEEVRMLKAYVAEKESIEYVDLENPVQDIVEDCLPDLPVADEEYLVMEKSTPTEMRCMDNVEGTPDASEQQGDPVPVADDEDLEMEGTHGEIVSCVTQNENLIVEGAQQNDNRTDIYSQLDILEQSLDNELKGLEKVQLAEEEVQPSEYVAQPSMDVVVTFDEEEGLPLEEGLSQEAGGNKANVEGNGEDNDGVREPPETTIVIVQDDTDEANSAEPELTKLNSADGATSPSQTSSSALVFEQIAVVTPTKESDGDVPNTEMDDDDDQNVDNTIEYWRPSELMAMDNFLLCRLEEGAHYPKELVELEADGSGGNNRSESCDTAGDDAFEPLKIMSSSDSEDEVETNKVELSINNNHSDVEGNESRDDTNDNKNGEKTMNVGPMHGMSKYEDEVGQPDPPDRELATAVDDYVQFWCRKPAISSQLNEAIE